MLDLMKVIVLLLCVVVAAGCTKFGFSLGTKGSGKIRSEFRKVGDFDAISVQGAADVRVTIGGAQSVKIETDDNILPLIETTLDGRTLVIGSKSSYNATHGVRVTVNAAKFSKMSILGSGDAEVRGVVGPDFEAVVKGSGDVTASGWADRVNGEVDGSGDLKFYELRAKDAKMVIRGSGDAQLSASDSIDASVAGSGDVTYKGHPKVQSRVAGSGHISPVD